MELERKYSSLQKEQSRKLIKLMFRIIYILKYQQVMNSTFFFGKCFVAVCVSGQILDGKKLKNSTSSDQKS